MNKYYIKPNFCLVDLKTEGIMDFVVASPDDGGDEMDARKSSFQEDNDDLIDNPNVWEE